MSKAKRRAGKEKPKKAVGIHAYEVISCHFSVGSKTWRRGEKIKLYEREAEAGLEAGALRKVE